MDTLSRRSLLRASLAAAAAGTLARPYLARAAATTATVWWTQGFIRSEDSAFRQLVAGYEKVSGNKIEYSIVPYAPLRQKETSAVTSGVVPDVMEAADYFFIPFNAWKDKLLDVTDIVETQKSHFNDIAMLSYHNYNSVTKQRSYYGVPMKASAVTFHIWKSLVEKAGHKVSDIPNTWDEFIDFFKPMQKALRDQGLRHTYSWGLEVSTNGVDPIRTFDGYMIAYGGKDLVTPDGKLHADDPQIREAVIKTLTRMAALYKDGYVPKGAINWNDADNNNAFHAKQLVADFNGSLSMELALIDKKEKYDDILTYAIPNGNDGKPLPAQIGIFGAMIPKGAKNVDVAKEFLKYAIEPKVLNEYLKAGLGRWAIPMPDIAKSDPFWLDSGDPHRTTYIKEILFRSTVPLHTAFNPAAAQLDAEHVFQVAWADMVHHGTTPEAAADKALKRAQEIFAKYPMAES
ncbi:MAG TPA: ABC transporter substrate-binding protein [Stellaceae bacterium]|nr:ABC transporter substrate-binding protein [Stellaceae bacterium]